MNLDMKQSLNMINLFILIYDNNTYYILENPQDFGPQTANSW